jgi:hypothetical protein
MEDYIDVFNILLFLVSSLLLFLTKNNRVLFYFFIFNFFSVVVFYLQYYFSLFQRFDGLTLLPGNLDLKVEKIASYIFSVAIIFLIGNYNIQPKKYLNKSDLSLFFLSILSVLFSLPLFFLGEGKGDFWTVALLMVPVLVSFKVIKSDVFIILKLLFVLLVFGLLILKSSKGIFLNYLIGIAVILLQNRKSRLAVFTFLFLISFVIAFVYNLNFQKEHSTGNSFLYIFEREYSVEVFMKVEEIDDYYKYFLLELYDIIPSSILSQFGVPKLGNSRVLFNDFNLDYAGDGAGYYIGSLTYVPLINTFFGKLLYLLGLGYMLRLFSIYFNNSFVLGLLIFNMDFLFNGNYSYFIILFFVPVIIVNVMQFLLKRNHRV